MATNSGRRSITKSQRMTSYEADTYSANLNIIPSDSGIIKIWGRYRRKPTERRAGMKVSSVWSLLLTRT